MTNTKVLAIHLPQFHTIPENDEWWGKGFTEWTNVRRGKALYPGHYQPREPLHDNYYDLADLRVLEKQIEIARKAGIYGFCFYHYYFRGKTLLEKPIESYRDNSKKNFPYCLIWANQSWTRTWYRGNSGNATLLQQSYGVQDDWKKHFNYLLTFFKDRRYIKINNKPVYIIYIPQDIPCRRQMFTLWNDMAKENGFDGLYLIAMKTTYGEDSCTRLYDAYMDFEPLNTLSKDVSWRHWLSEWKRKQRQTSESQALYINNDYSYAYLLKEICKRILAQNNSKEFWGLFPGWDNTPRKDEDGVVIRGSSPRLFYYALLFALKMCERKKKEFLFLNAWNEWSEGAYLEPDKKYGYSYLRAIRDAIHRIGEKTDE